MTVLTSLNGFDLAAGVLAFVFVLYGVFKGMARLTIGFLGLALAWILAARYAEKLALWIGAQPASSNPGPDALRLVSFALVFVAVVFAAAVVSWPVTKLLGVIHLRGLDRLAGAGLGLLLAILLICAATVPLMALSPPGGGAFVKQSTLAPYAVAGGEYLKELAGEPMRSRFAASARVLFGPGLMGRQSQELDSR